MSQFIDFILLVGFFAVLVWAIIEYLPIIRQFIDFLIY